MTQTVIPATIVTGFLGAGKTTLIRHLLTEAEGRRIALIVNEFGDMGFDAGLLAACGVEGCGEGDILELTNGCICCTVADDFLPAMRAILARPEPPDHIVIETSGLALPQPLVQAFRWPDVAGKVTVDGVVTVVDASAVAQGRVVADEAALAAQRAADESLDHESPVEELFEDQLRCADLVVLAKADLVDGTTLDKVRTRIAARIRPGVEQVRGVAGAVPVEAVLGLARGAEQDPSDREALHHHHNGGDDDHDHDEFDSFIVAASADSREAAEAMIAAAAKLPGVLRIKGFAKVAGKAAPLAVQAVGPRIETWFTPGGAAEANLVVIGLDDMDRAAVEAVFAEARTQAA